jgi:signal transduction histidine kinase
MQTRSWPPEFHAPLPGGQFRWFMMFWHTLFVVGLAVTWTLAVCYRPDVPLGRAGVLALLVLVQGGLYLRTFIRSQQGFNSWEGWTAYFAASLVIWMVEVYLDNRFEWLVGAYTGQILGVLPPKASVPSAIVILGGYLAYRLGWENLAHLRTVEILMWGVTVVSWMILGLFLHKLAVTSSERAGLIAELHTARKQVELARQSDAELAALRERERLARELHDNLGHALSTLAVQLEAIQRLMAVDPTQARAQIDEMKNLARACMEGLRRALSGLRTPGLGNQLLTEAIPALVKETSQRCGLAIDCRIANEAGHLPPKLAEGIWRVTHEALANAERHAQATNVNVSLQGAEKELVLCISDNGVGFPEAAEQRPGHFGLRGLRERVEGLGGTLTLSPAGQPGAQVEARWPVAS